MIRLRLRAAPQRDTSRCPNGYCRLSTLGFKSLSLDSLESNENTAGVCKWLRMIGGERGIRTLDTSYPVYQLSRLAPSTTRPPLLHTFLLLTTIKPKLTSSKRERDGFGYRLGASPQRSFATLRNRRSPFVEPSIRVTPYTNFPGWRLRPLGHLSYILSYFLQLSNQNLHQVNERGMASAIASGLRPNAASLRCATGVRRLSNPRYELPRIPCLLSP